MDAERAAVSDTAPKANSFPAEKEAGSCHMCSLPVGLLAEVGLLSSPVLSQIQVLAAWAVHFPQQARTAWTLVFKLDFDKLKPQ